MSTLTGYITPYEAAAALKVSHSTVCRYIRLEQLRAVRQGNQLYIRPTDIKRFKKPPRGNPNFGR